MLYLFRRLRDQFAPHQPSVATSAQAFCLASDGPEGSDANGDLPLLLLLGPPERLRERLQLVRAVVVPLASRRVTSSFFQGQGEERPEH